MLRTALKVGAGLTPRRVANGGAAAGGGRRVFSSLQEALVNVTFVDAEVREVTYSTWYLHTTDVRMSTLCVSSLVLALVLLLVQDTCGFGQHVHKTLWIISCCVLVKNERNT